MRLYLVAPKDFNKADVAHDLAQEYYDRKTTTYLNHALATNTANRTKGKVLELLIEVIDHSDYIQPKCNACNGTGYYDDTDSPKCGACNGKGYNE